MFSSLVPRSVSKLNPFSAKNCNLARQVQSVRKYNDQHDGDERSAPLQNVDNLKCINRVQLLGRAVGPAFYSSGNTEMASFTLVTNDVRKNRENDLIRRSEFHKVQVFIPRLVNKTRQVVQKGSRIYVEGRLNYNVRKNEDGNQYFTNIIADNMIFFTGNREALFENEEVEEPETQSATP